MTVRPRLLVMTSTFPAAHDDGTPAFVRDLAAQEAVDFETVVLAPCVRGAARRETTNGLVVERFRYFPRRWEDLADGAIMENLRVRPSRWLQVLPFLVAEIFALRRAVVRHRPDVLHVHWLIPQGVAALVAGGRLPRVVTTHGGDLYALQDPLSTRLKRAVLRRSTAVTTMNDDMRIRAIALGADPDTTWIMPMGADVNLVRSAGAEVERVPGRVAFVGRLVEKKGVGVLLDALRRLDAGTRYTVEVVGDGPLGDELRHRAKGLPIVFRGLQGRRVVAATYAAADIAVFPSMPASSGDQDGLPVTLMEAMAAGCAIVASRIPGIDAAITDGEHGLMVPPGDPDALADSLLRLLDDADLRARLGAAAAVRGEDFSIAATGARYRARLHEAIRARAVKSVSS